MTSFGPTRFVGMRFVVSYPFTAASGILGPKLREGDRQVPEGVYRIEYLNPKSKFHLSLKTGYPNEFDRRLAAAEGRTNLGGDIMIHGGAASIGCIAIGDEGIEEVFALVADAGRENATVILSPVDFRHRELPEDMPPVPRWTARLYQTIRRELSRLPANSDPTPSL